MTLKIHYIGRAKFRQFAQKHDDLTAQGPTVRVQWPKSDGLIRRNLMIFKLNRE